MLSVACVPLCLGFSVLNEKKKELRKLILACFMFYFKSWAQLKQTGFEMQSFVKTLSEVFLYHIMDLTHTV